MARLTSFLILISILNPCLAKDGTGQDQKKDRTVIVRMERDGKPIDMTRDPDRFSLWARLSERVGDEAKSRGNAAGEIELTLPRAIRTIALGRAKPKDQDVPTRDWFFKLSEKAEDVRLSFDLSSKKFSGSAKTSQGQPIPRTAVVAVLRKPARNYDLLEELNFVEVIRADEKGEFTFSDLLDGEYALDVMGDDLKSPSEGFQRAGNVAFVVTKPGKIDLKDGDGRLDLPVILGLDYSINFHLESNGAPSAGIPVTLALQYGGGERERSGRISRTQKTDEKGFCGSDFPAGELSVGVAHPIFGELVSRRDLSGTPGAVDLRYSIPNQIAMGTVTAKITHEKELPWNDGFQWKIVLEPDFETYAKDGQKPPLLSRREIMLSKEGNHPKFDCVIPGRYQVALRVRASGYTSDEFLKLAEKLKLAELGSSQTIQVDKAKDTEVNLRRNDQ